MLLGAIAFVLAIVTMKTNWRAGFGDGQNTSLVTAGIYKYSRNPAFLGFDLLYIGCALAFPNVLNIAFAVLAVVLFHIQILGEEVFLKKTFGTEYEDYKAKTMRYLGYRKDKK
jgi:protein-S-isoprenylcysteine O-methyltransferase Ste14